MHDLVLHGGRVIDPASGLDGIHDVAVKDGRIAAIAPHIARNGAAAVTRDVSGKLVLPGLIDTHAHVFRYMTAALGLDADWVGIQSGVTTLVEQGGVSAATLPGYAEYVVKAKANRVFAFLAPYVAGGVGGFLYPDQFTPDTIDIDLTLRAFEQHGDIARGMKFWAEQASLLKFGTAAIEKTVRIANEVQAPMYVHLGELWKTPDAVKAAFPADRVLETVLPFLRPGDIFAHPYTAQAGGYFDAGGKVRALVREARAMGMHFDLGYGTATSIELMQRGIDQDFVPDTLGADLHAYNTQAPDPGINPRNIGRFQATPGVVNGMNLLMACGLPLERVVPMATASAARLFLRPGDGAGSLAVGALADISVLDDQRGKWRMRDNSGGSVVAERLLRASFCVRAGQLHEACSPLTQPIEAL
ncbi:amidohydrolase family protein [Massilia putida]|uniref:amidohydrolase family protein n=1 Tax=Massilia putida TaxID=1141883 RepID=UPI000952A51E|nr:amidohydrolase family protein [Massilia putida]